MIGLCDCELSHNGLGMVGRECDCQAGRTIRVLCESCGGEGRILKSRYGGNDPDVWDAGPCPVCDGTAYVTIETHPVTMDEINDDR